MAVPGERDLPSIEDLTGPDQVMSSDELADHVLHYGATRLLGSIRICSLVFASASVKL